MYTVGLVTGAYGDLAGATVTVLGASYRGGVKETAFSGVFPTVAALRAQGARVLVHDPMFDDEELRGLGFEPYHLGEPLDVAVVQADHAAYLNLSKDDLPGVRVVVDGRNMLDAGRFEGVTFRVVGRAP